MVFKAIRVIGHIIKDTAVQWAEDQAARLGAALAFYMLISLVPLLVVVLGVSSLLFGPEAAEGEVARRLAEVVGESAAVAIQSIIHNANSSYSGTQAAVLGFGALTFTSTTVFYHLKSALNTIWGVKPAPGRGVKGLLKDRAMAFLMVMLAGGLLIASLTIDTSLVLLQKALHEWIPHLNNQIAVIRSLRFAKLLISLIFVTVAFATIYKFLPDTQIAWRDVSVGAVVTSLLFSLGQLPISFYLHHSNFGSIYGAAGSVFVVLIWMYCSAQIFFFGAEFTWVYANKYGSRILPNGNSVRVIRIHEPHPGPSPEEHSRPKKRLPPPWGDWEQEAPGL